MSETISRANGVIAVKTRAYPNASRITRADANLNVREALATLAVMRHKLGVIGYPTDLVRWASIERPRHNPAGWELADEAYRADSRRRIEDAADHYIAAAAPTADLDHIQPSVETDLTPYENGRSMWELDR